MNIANWLISAIVGALLSLFGVVLMLWGRKEAHDDDITLTEHTGAHHDVRKFLEGERDTSGPGSLKTGGIITVVIGVFLLLLSLYLALTGA